MRKERARWIVAGVLIAPFAILGHEAGHALVAVGCGCATVTIRYAYTIYLGCPTSGEVIRVAAGPIASWLICTVAWLGTRSRPRPVLYVLALCTAGRPLYGLAALVDPAVDEAKRSGIPAVLWVAPQLIAAVVVFRWGWRLAGSTKNGVNAILAMAAAAASAALYLFVLGPLLLP